MGLQFLIDTNTIIELLAGRLPTPTGIWLDEAAARGLVAYSVINRIEVLSWPAADAVEFRTTTEWLAATHQLLLSEPVVTATINLRRSYRRKLPDAIIAATALVHGLAIVTRNLSDFKSISGLTVVDPHDAAALPPL